MRGLSGRRTAHVIHRPWWYRHPLLCGLIVTLIILSYLDHRRHPDWHGDDRTRYHARVFSCTRVVDGDTIVVAAPDGRQSGITIRLRGVDTPELARDGRPAMHFAVEARDFAERHLANRQVRLELGPGHTRDRFGRLLAGVILEHTGVCFNLSVVERGYGYADRRFDDPLLDAFIAAEEQARNAGLGLWEHITLADMPAWRRRFEQDR